MASLTLAESEQILAAAKAKVFEMGAKMSVSVVDPRGDLICMCRTDGASWRTPAISRAKAVSAACFGRPSGDLTDNAMSPVFRGLMALEGGHLIPGQGTHPPELGELDAPPAEADTFVPLKSIVVDAERVHIRKALDLHHGNRTHAAKALGISRKNLWEKMKNYGME